MLRTKTTIVALLGLWLLAGVSGVRAGEKVDNKITAYLRAGATESQAVVEIWMENANPVRGVSLPFKFATGDIALAFDSLKTAGGRAAAFAFTPPLYKAENQTLLLNLLQGLTKEKQAPPIPVGNGPLVWIYLSTKGKFPAADFKMASVRIEPQNVLLYVTDTYNSVTPVFEFTRNDPPAPAKAEAKDEAKGATP
ncbi:MAG: hypothetical protein AB1752_10890 [Candidatus Zixiibacteriota bacterium]